MLEQSREELIVNCNKIEKNMILLNQGFDKNNISDTSIKKTSTDDNTNPNLHMEDINSDDDTNTRRKSIYFLFEIFKILFPYNPDLQLNFIE